MARAKTAKLMLVIARDAVAGGDPLEFFGRDIRGAVRLDPEKDEYFSDIAGDDFLAFLGGVPWADVEALTADLKASAKEWPCCVVGFQVVP